jgi:hypothetical protein
VVGLVLYAALLLVGSTAGLFLGFLSDGCSSPGDCDTGLLGAGIACAVLGTWVPYVAALVGVVVQVARGRRGWWLPPAGLVLSVLVFLAGVGLATAGGPHG